MCNRGYVFEAFGSVLTNVAVLLSSASFHDVQTCFNLLFVNVFSLEHRNTPLEDGLVTLARNLNAYVSNLRVGSEQQGMGFLLNQLADGKHLSIAELERIILHLQERRDRLVEAEGGKAPRRIPLSQPQTGAGSVMLSKYSFVLFLFCFQWLYSVLS